MAAIAPLPYDQSTMVEKLPPPDSYLNIGYTLGKGNYGSVFKAVDLETKATVAVKVVPWVEDERNDILGEVKIMGQLIHPNIVRCLGLYFKSEQLWIVLEYCEHGALTEILKVYDKGLKEEHISFVGYEVLKGLAFLHEHNIIHRDIKCDNILVSTNSEIKIADFGISSFLSPEKRKTDTFVGTPFWMAPEVIEVQDTGVGYGTACDIWSFGITLIEMAEAKPPFHEYHPMRALTLILTSPPATLSNPKKFSKEFNNLISLCLDKMPQLRPTCEELLKHPFLQLMKKSATFVKKPQSFSDLVQKAGQIRSVLATQHKPLAPSPFDLDASRLVLEDDDIFFRFNHIHNTLDKAPLFSNPLFHNFSPFDVSHNGDSQDLRPSQDSSVGGETEIEEKDSEDQEKHEASDEHEDAEKLAETTEGHDENSADPHTPPRQSEEKDTLGELPQSPRLKDAQRIIQDSLPHRRMSRTSTEGLFSGRNSNISMPSRESQASVDSDITAKLRSKIAPVSAVEPIRGARGSISPATPTYELTESLPISITKNLEDSNCSLSVLQVMIPFEVTCFDSYIGGFLVGGANGLFHLDKAGVLFQLVDGKHVHQVKVIQELGIAMALGGKGVPEMKMYSLVEIHRSVKNGIRPKVFPVVKLKETTGCRHFLIEKIKDSWFLGVCLKSKVVLYMWAHFPHYKFMLVKDWDLKNKPLNCSFVSTGKALSNICVQTRTEFLMIDVATNSIQELELHVQNPSLPVSSWSASDGNLLLAYQDRGFFMDGNNYFRHEPIFKWNIAPVRAVSIGDSVICFGTRSIQILDKNFPTGPPRMVKDDFQKLTFLRVLNGSVLFAAKKSTDYFFIYLLAVS